MDAPTFGGSNPVVLRSGASLSCGAAMGREQWLALSHAGSTQRLVLPYPHAGLGGQELVVSPDERYAVLFVYSGQSEQGYELLELSPTLRHLRSVPYREGKGDAPMFSPDGRWLAMLVTTTPMVRGTDQYAEDAFDPAGEGEVLVDWAELLVQAVPDGTPRVTAIGTVLPRSFDHDTFADWRLHGALGFAADDRVTLRLPWSSDARLEVALPAAEAITTSTPA